MTTFHEEVSVKFCSEKWTQGQDSDVQLTVKMDLFKIVVKKCV